MKTYKIEYIPLRKMLSADEYSLCRAHVLPCFRLGDANVSLFSAIEIANLIERKIEGEAGKNMALKVLALPESVYIQVEQ